ncbi:Protein SCARECROW 1 [Acorus calamus]|uniref:Protein SCARECROW 1 n=1 Tax=Acorus calamus TaxID=4465 RepID=A0AAV9CJY8_ACOCL|nr:Protein SCARECROW 1 [Acorus calamus]
MKGEFEVHGALDLIQPHDHCDYLPHHVLGSSTSSSKPNTEQFDLSDWVQRVEEHLSEDLHPDPNIAEVAFSIESLPQMDHFIPQTKCAKCDNNGEDSDDKNLGLITLLLECAVSISLDQLDVANKTLLELSQMASPYALSCAERIVAYFTQAMSSRVMNSWLGMFSPINNPNPILNAFQAFNTISPFIKFSHFTSNQAILEAFQGRARVHIIDLDIMQGLQWPALFHILATRACGPPHVRLTGFGASMESLNDTGRRLSQFARRLGMSFEYYPMARKFGEVEPSVVVGRRGGEAVAVHWARHSLYDVAGPDWKAMGVLEAVAPRVITLVEQEIAPRGGSFLDRFVGCLHYYSTMFDSLGATLPVDDTNRYQVEHCLLAREINNILAVGGPARSGEEKFGEWRVELGRRGFVQVPMSANSMAQAQLILNMFPGGSQGYTVFEGDGMLRFGWKGTGLYVASAWTSRASM